MRRDRIRAFLLLACVAAVAQTPAATAVGSVQNQSGAVARGNRLLRARLGAWHIAAHRAAPEGSGLVTVLCEGQ